MSSKSARTAYKIAGAAIVLVAISYCLFKLRNSADGFRNLFSLRYWMERRAGFDLYVPSEHYLKRGRRDRHDLLLTFDDGPHPGSCESILSTLEKVHVRAAFFVVGRRVKQRPDLIRRMIADGDEVGNHTQDHLRLDTLTAAQVANEIANCDTNIQRACGYRTKLLRPPGMRLTPTVLEQIDRMGYTVIGWNVGAKDFIPDQQVTDMTAEESANLRTTPDEVVQRVMKQVKDGTIVLLHDNPVTAAALSEIIQDCKRQGYEFKSCAQFLAELPHPITVVANPKCVVTTKPPVPKHGVHA
jgi:peptidoglycan/xylan/chitin deacetylase (PgdA/CDA1 family)